ncbi:bleomycin resistance protein [Microbacterium saperdae]|uniref:Bleomycin resistance protein n=1 Tax=Microbacterium saperdae TaxID=69368 RepID=A0A543BBI2_9MICO|nr:bleomycin resistance protein [Microbacterium saperdae]TQL82211.1 putative glyoxalase superfamily protein PhnB [Microbacterium saperdae]GGM38051.1 bleomycin resistance protein [Microbacterium saperdae]
MTDHAVPNLPSRDFDDTIAFYGGFGFELSYRDDGWLILHRGELQLEFFLFPEHVPARSSFLCSIRVDDVDALYRQIAQAGVIERSTGFPRLHPVRAQPWGQRAGFLVDREGTQLHLIENGSPDRSESR